MIVPGDGTHVVTVPGVGASRVIVPGVGASGVIVPEIGALRTRVLGVGLSGLILLLQKKKIVVGRVKPALLSETRKCAYVFGIIFGEACLETKNTERILLPREITVDRLFLLRGHYYQSPESRQEHRCHPEQGAQEGRG